jgi:hypothetical protein
LGHDCASQPDAGSFAEVDLVLDRVERLLEVGEASIDVDRLTMLDTHTKALSQACGD